MSCVFPFIHRMMTMDFSYGMGPRPAAKHKERRERRDSVCS
jgi:hypothetical protein